MILIITKSYKFQFFLFRTDIFRLLVGDKIGKINKIQVRTDGTGEDPSWLLKEVGSKILFVIKTFITLA